VIQKLLGILGHLARQYGVEVQTELQASQAVVVATDATLSEIFFNLIKNGIEACQNCSLPRVLITTQVVNGILEVQVVDNGAGISPELQNSLFQPFVTGKPKGTGLDSTLLRNAFVNCEAPSAVGLKSAAERPLNCGCHWKPNRSVSR
jgi:C4-dicarboxylate-specific signal transduction histidine kinase